MTAHAVEEGPASHVRRAISPLDVQRIYHGIWLAEDDALMDEMSSKRMLVNLCP